MKRIYTKQTLTSRTKRNWNRDEVACNIVDFEKNKQKQSQREFTLEYGIPRTTLQYWQTRKNVLEHTIELGAFFESPVGSAFLHRLLVTLHYEFGKKGTASIHNISNFLKLTGLDPFVASSYTTQNRVTNDMDLKIVEFGHNEAEQGMRSMPKKKITLLEDETFHPQICLVTIEAVSNYIMVEKYAANRTADTWNAAVDEAMKGLNVEVIQVASDGAKALLKHTCKGLGAHHSPDSFHVIQEIGKGTSAPLSSKVKKAEANYKKAVDDKGQITATKDRYEMMSPRPVGRRPDFDKKISAAFERECAAQKNLDQALENQEIVIAAKKDIGQVYHPYSLGNGNKQDAQQIRGLLESCFERIQIGTRELSEKCQSKVDKAHRVVNSMVATIAFFFQMVELYMDNKNISSQDRELMHNHLIPGFYLQEAAVKEKDRKKKTEILRVSRELLKIISTKEGSPPGYSPEQINMLIESSKECVTFFQRSSSCVEGRNAQLSLRHHGRHRLSDTHLKAQTVLHNFTIKNSEGTTPAERFFETKHKDLFEWLLENMAFPARPRKRLKHAA